MGNMTEKKAGFRLLVETASEVEAEYAIPCCGGIKAARSITACFK